MSVTVTQVLDMIKRPQFAKTMEEAIVKKSAFYRSGIISKDPEIAKRVMGRGEGDWLVNLPFYKSLTETASDAEPIVEGQDATPGKIEMGNDIANITRRIKAFGVTDLAREVTGDDPLTEIANQLADYWLLQDSKKMFATLKGVFAATSMADLVLDLTGGGTLDGESTKLTTTTILDAAQLLGDAKGGLTGVAMNSLAETYLTRLDNANKYYKPSEQNNLASYNGKTLIVDDQCPCTTYDTAGSGAKRCTRAEIYLFGLGAIAEAPAFISVPNEPDRNALGSSTNIVSRHGGIMHIRGVKWNGTATNAANTALETGTNWVRVWNKKNIRVVKLIANIAEIDKPAEG